MAVVLSLRHWVEYIYPHTAWSRAIGAWTWFPRVPLVCKNGAAPQLLPHLEGLLLIWTLRRTKVTCGLYLKLSRSDVGPDADWPDWYFRGFRQFIQDNSDKSHPSDSLPPFSTILRIFCQLLQLMLRLQVSWSPGFHPSVAWTFPVTEDLK